MKKKEIDEIIHRWRNMAYHKSGYYYTSLAKRDREVIKEALEFYRDFKELLSTLGHLVFWSIVCGIVLGVIAIVT